MPHPAKIADPSCHPLGDKNPGRGYVDLPPPRTAVLELRVRNHPGTMSHITGLFARRAFNLDAILCAPVGDGKTSTMLLLVSNEPRLEQVERQLEKLHDVLTVRHRADVAPEFFARCVGDRSVRPFVGADLSANVCSIVPPAGRK